MTRPGDEPDPQCYRPRCGDPLSAHAGNLWSAEGCSTCGCCVKHLVDSDCLECDGTGTEERASRVSGTIRIFPCGDCDGTGLSDWAREDEAS
jgi:hypothetical protein